jgi:hypothetical protein
MPLRLFVRLSLILSLLSLSCAGGMRDPIGEDDEETSSGRCGVSRWSVKTGTDPSAGMVNLQARDTTIAQLGAIPAPSSLPANNRISPTELQTVRIANATLRQYRMEKDSDYHLVLTDGTNTMIAEIPDPACVSAGPFQAGITTARRTFDAKYTVGPLVGGNPGPWQTSGETVTVYGVSFFDDPHSQTGAAPNAIEVHPIMKICFGQNCDSGTGDDFSMAANPTTLASNGAAATSSITVSAIGTFSKNVTLTASGLPTGATARFSPNPVPAGGTSTLTLNPGSASTGTYSVAITGNATGGLSHATLISWTISTGTAADFSLTATPSTVTSTAGASATSTVVMSPQNGFAGTVALSVSGVPTGAQGRLSASSITANGDSTLTLQPGTAQAGNYTITVTGTSGSLTHATSVSWTVGTGTGDTPPVAQITSPSAGATVADTVTLVSRDSDPDGDPITRVDFYVDGTLLGSDTVSPYSHAWDTTTVANGGHTISVTAYDAANHSGTASISVTVANNGTPSDLIVNGGFESSLQGWTLGGTKLPIHSTAHPHTGTYSLRTGATTYVPRGDSWATQQVSIPADVSSAMLSFWYYAESSSSIRYEWQEAKILDTNGNVLLPIFHMVDNSQVWTRHVVDLSAFRGATVAVYFNTHCDGGVDPTTMWIDDVSLVVQ